MHPSLDLDRYFTRIDYRGGRAPTAGTLSALHLAHVTHIPFENLDVLLGKPIRLDLESIQEKLVRGNRGGYCFEQNALFAAVLENLGFKVTRQAGRVRLGVTRTPPRIHMVLRVEADGHEWLADVGYGGWGLLEPIRLADGEEKIQFGWPFHLRREDDAWVVKAMRLGVWQDLYSFTPEPQHPVDYELGNHFCSTHPQSPFVQNVTAQLALPECRRVMRGGVLSIYLPDGSQTIETIQGDKRLLQVLDEHFRLKFPAGVQFRPRYS